MELMPLKSGPLEHMTVFDAHREKCPVTFGDALGHDFWLVSRMEEIRTAFQTPEVFSNWAVVPYDPDPPYKWIPQMLDGDEHLAWRPLLGPFFTPKTVDGMEEKMRQLFREILDDVADRGECDFVQDVALRFPNTIFMEMLGLPIDDAATFQAWETRILHNAAAGGDDHLVAMGEVIAYFGELIEQRRQEPKDDFLSKVIDFKIDDQPVKNDDLMALLLLLFMAGLDTVAMQLSYSLLHLATHPERIVNDPELIPSAVEEFVRYYAFVTPGRKVMQDTELGGCPIKAGQMVFLPLVSANRDPREFPDAHKVLLDRSPNPHIGFGAGPHRCLGSHLARRELKVELEEWHRRIPEYSLVPDVPITEHGGQMGLDNLPLRWPAR
jgi:cytochrome P450